MSVREHLEYVVLIGLFMLLTVGVFVLFPIQPCCEQQAPVLVRCYDVETAEEIQNFSVYLFEDYGTYFYSRNTTTGKVVTPNLYKENGIFLCVIRADGYENMLVRYRLPYLVAGGSDPMFVVEVPMFRGGGDSKGGMVNPSPLHPPTPSPFLLRQRG